MGYINSLFLLLDKMYKEEILFTLTSESEAGMLFLVWYNTSSVFFLVSYNVYFVASRIDTGDKHHYIPRYIYTYTLDLTK